MENQKRSLPATPFFSLFVPNVPSQQDSWVRDLISKKSNDLKASEMSLSQYLTELVLVDMCDRSVIPEKRLAQYYTYAKNKNKIRKTRMNQDTLKGTFCLYFSRKKGMEWLENALSSETIKKKTGAKSRSMYIWDLFVRSNDALLTPEQRAQWASYASEARTGRDGKKKKIAA